MSDELQTSCSLLVNYIIKPKQEHYFKKSWPVLMSARASRAAPMHVTSVICIFDSDIRREHFNQNQQNKI